jgi:hypothetical protein
MPRSGAGPAVTSRRRRRHSPDGASGGGRHGAAKPHGFVVVLVAVGALATGCSAVSKIKQAVHNVEGNKATIDSFSQNL